MRIAGNPSPLSIEQAQATAASAATELDDANGFNDPSKIFLSGAAVTYNGANCPQ